MSSRSGQHALLLPLDDPERMGELLLDLEPRLCAVALRTTRHPESARDVVQNAFEKVLLHGERFRGPSLVSTWLHRIVTNEALMWLRTQRRRGEGQANTDPAELAAVPDPAPGPAERLQRRERESCVHNGLQALSPDERDVLLRCALPEESYAAYGARTGIHPAAAKSRAFRARHRLGTLLRQPAESSHRP